MKQIKLFFKRNTNLTESFCLTQHKPVCILHQLKLPKTRWSSCKSPRTPSGRRSSTPFPHYKLLGNQWRCANRKQGGDARHCTSASSCWWRSTCRWRGFPMFCACSGTRRAGTSPRTCEAIRGRDRKRTILKLIWCSCFTRKKLEPFFFSEVKF